MNAPIANPDVPLESVQRASFIMRYSSDPAFRAVIDVERAVVQARINAGFKARVDAFHARRAAERAGR